MWPDHIMIVQVQWNQRKGSITWSDSGVFSVTLYVWKTVCDLYRLKTQIWGRRLREIRSDENIVPAGWRCGCNWSGGTPVSVWQMFHGDQACFKQPNTLCLHGNEIRTSERCWPARHITLINLIFIINIVFITVSFDFSDFTFPNQRHWSIDQIY